MNSGLFIAIYAIVFAALTMQILPSISENTLTNYRVQIEHVANGKNMNSFNTQVFQFMTRSSDQKCAKKWKLP